MLQWLSTGWNIEWVVFIGHQGRLYIKIVPLCIYITVCSNHFIRGNADRSWVQSQIQVIVKTVTMVPIASLLSIGGWIWGVTSPNDPCQGTTAAAFPRLYDKRLSFTFSDREDVKT